MDQNRARAACKEKIGGCMSGCAGKREQKGVRDCRGGLIGVSVCTAIAYARAKGSDPDAVGNLGERK
jgi:hypothetical protein